MLLIEKYRQQVASGNKINGISPKNPKKSLYIQAAIETFGEILGLVYFFG